PRGAALSRPAHAAAGGHRQEHGRLPSLGDRVRLRRSCRRAPRAARRRASADDAADRRDRRAGGDDRPSGKRHRAGRRRPHAGRASDALGAERVMERVRGRFIVLALTGSIAVYKMIELARRLVQAGATVQVVMSKGATEFVTPLTFQALTYRPVAVEMFAMQDGLAAIERIASAIDDALAVSQTLAGRRVVVTAGPTIEAIDPVRFVSNRSSGKMGYAIAAAARDAGAEVTLITGPTALAAPAGVRTFPVESADDMKE